MQEQRTLRPAIIEQQRPGMGGTGAHGSQATIQSTAGGTSGGRNFSVNRTNNGSFGAQNHHKQNSTGFISKDIKSFNKSMIHPSLNGGR
jgi:hypothetical protein